MLSVCRRCSRFCRLSAAAAEETGTVGALTYILESDGAVITKCEETAEKVVIPEKIAGKPVTEIAEDAFQFCENLTSVEIPDTVPDDRKECVLELS